MKKLVIIFVVLTFAVNSIYAQEENAKFHFGLKASPSISWMKPDIKGISSDGSNINFSYGLITEFNITSSYLFSTGIEIMNTGGNLSFDANNVYYISDNDTIHLDSRKYNLRYLNIPIGLKFKTKEVGYFTYFAQCGIDIGLRLKATADDKVKLQNNTNTLTSADIDIIDDTQFFRTALNIGIGFEYGLVGNTVLLVGINYNNGFSNALQKNSKQLKDINNNNEPIEQKAYTNYVSLTLGVLF